MHSLARSHTTVVSRVCAPLPALLPATAMVRPLLAAARARARTPAPRAALPRHACRVSSCAPHRAAALPHCLFLLARDASFAAVTPHAPTHPPNQLQSHTILLLQPVREKSSRTFYEYPSVPKAIEGVCPSCVHKNKRRRSPADAFAHLHGPPRAKSLSHVPALHAPTASRRHHHLRGRPQDAAAPEHPDHVLRSRPARVAGHAGEFSGFFLLLFFLVRRVARFSADLRPAKMKD